VTAPFTYDVAGGRVVFGRPAATAVPEELDRLDARRVLVVAGPEHDGLVGHLAPALGPRLVERIGRVQQHVPATTAVAARATARRSEADAVVTIGGGSATGVGKAIRLELDLRFVAVPTTFAGSEMTRIWGLTDAGHKRTGRDERVKADVVVYDPALLVGLPPSVAGPSGLNALAHCVEALYAPGANPITSALARRGARAIGRALPRACARPDDLDALGEALLGACLAGVALDSAGTALHHKACHVLGGMFDLPHGPLHGVLLPHALAYTAPAVPDAMAAVARDLAAPGGPSGVLALARAVGAPTTLAELGMPRDGIEAAAIEIVREAASNPRPPELPGIRAMLEDAFDGRDPRAAPAG
jgi:maleylacetate reductase